jgi:hypothetical protein
MSGNDRRTALLGRIEKIRELIASFFRAFTQDEVHHACPPKQPYSTVQLPSINNPAARAGSNVPTNLPTTTIVEAGSCRFTRNPIYFGMVLGLIGLAIAFNSLWLLMTLAFFALVIRYGVITREEAYLERKFGDVYRRYCARVRRWL